MANFVTKNNTFMFADWQNPKFTHNNKNTMCSKKEN